MTVKPAIIPNLRYRNAPAAIDFLCEAFGFEKHVVFTDENDPAIVQHAQLVRDGNMIMVSSVLETEFSHVLTTVKQAGGNTQTLYIVLDDVDAHAKQAKSKGAKIILSPEDKDYGGRGYSAADPEGNAWSFGNYDPWASE